MDRKHLFNKVPKNTHVKDTSGISNFCKLLLHSNDVKFDYSNEDFNSHSAFVCRT